MDNKNNIEDFFKNPFAKEYLIYNDSVIRYSVSGISVVCEMLNENLRKKKSNFDDACITEMTNCIMEMCYNLMRSSELSTMLANIPSAELNYSIVEVRDFIRLFSEKCSTVTMNKVLINCSCDGNFRINTDIDILVYFMIRFVRRFALSCEKNAEFELMGRCVDDSVEIILKFKKDESKEIISVEDDFPEKYRDEINKMFSDKLSFKTEYGEDFMKVTSALYKGEKKSDLENGRIIFSTDKFSKFNIMLEDINKKYQ